MERLTSNKKVSDMSMIELTHNSCYVDNKRNARYRDYNLDIDSRELVRNLVKDICDEDLTDLSDEEFDEYMSSMLSVGIDSTMGLLALFYRNLWAMSDLRERLKEYEDYEEQGRLVKLPCKVGDTVYLIDRDENNKFKIYEGKWKRVPLVQTSKNGLFNLRGEISYDKYDCFYDDGKTMKHGMYVGQEHTKIGEVVFLTKSEAEAKLKELRGGENERFN